MAYTNTYKDSPYRFLYATPRSSNILKYPRKKSHFRRICTLNSQILCLSLPLALTFSPLFDLLAWYVDTNCKTSLLPLIYNITCVWFVLAKVSKPSKTHATVNAFDTLTAALTTRVIHIWMILLVSESVPSLSNDFIHTTLNFCKNSFNVFYNKRVKFEWKCVWQYENLSWSRMSNMWMLTWQSMCRVRWGSFRFSVLLLYARNIS